MAIFICEYCGKEFTAKPSAHRKFCSRECASKAKEGKPCDFNLKEHILVKCAECGKEEYVRPSRAKRYVCCSVECLAKHNSKKYSQKVECECPVCHKHFEIKKSHFDRVKSIPCCSKSCANKLKETTYLGEGNPQYGLKGEKNASFKGIEISHVNHNIVDTFVYMPEHPKANRDGRVTRHRLVVEQNYHLYDPKFFDVINGFHVLKPGYQVHHKDGNHSNDDVSNLQIVTMSEHRTIHNTESNVKLNKFDSIIGVIKRGELLETLEIDNQQPSLDSNVLEGSTTNNRVRFKSDSNVDTSALLLQILNIVIDDIV